MSGKPLKVLVVDTQVYSNTGGQACTSGFLGQISDMAQFGKAWKGKQEIRKEIGLIGMAHRTTYVMQSTIAYPSHMIEGFIEGLKARAAGAVQLLQLLPARARHRRRHERHRRRSWRSSRAPTRCSATTRTAGAPRRVLRPRRQPGAGPADWPTYTLKYRKRASRAKTMEVPLTFADFAITEARFRKHFPHRPPTPGTTTWCRWPSSSSSTRRTARASSPTSGRWTASSSSRACWWTGRWSNRARSGAASGPAARARRRRPEDRSRVETARGRGAARGVAERLAGRLLELAADGSAAALRRAGGEAGSVRGARGRRADDGYMAPWIDTLLCTSCDECIKINEPASSSTTGQGKATIREGPEAGPYSDLVKAAEKCTARVIHPGLPRDRNFKDAAKWIARGEKYN
jgi:pyruvate-ferredoxin/flavodoxin oxidoreductase